MKTEEIKISRKEAIEEHRKMWNWIADETLKRKTCVHKHDYLNKFYPDLHLINDCFLCDYAGYISSDYFSLNNTMNCEECPLDWGSPNCCARIGVVSYYHWSDAVSLKKWKSAAKYAREIANLKEKGAENMTNCHDNNMDICVNKNNVNEEGEHLFPIYFSDLNKDAQSRILKATGVDDPKEMNWDMDILPLAYYPINDILDDSEFIDIKNKLINAVNDNIIDD